MDKLIFYIVSKIEYINGRVVYTEVEQTDDIVYIESIQKNYEKTYQKWVDTNKDALFNKTKNISEFFQTNNSVLVVTTKTENLKDKKDKKDK